MPASSSRSEILISREAARLLITLAREAITQWLGTGESARPKPLPHPELEKPFGVFVTLRKDGELRGCVGQIFSEIPVYLLIQDVAVSAASRDHRFESLKSSEWPKTQMEISLLSPLQRIFDSHLLTVGRHGIYVKKGPWSGVYLPEVAVEMRWASGEFIERCALEKAGLGRDEMGEAEKYIFTTQKITEK